MKKLISLMAFCGIAISCFPALSQECGGLGPITPATDDRFGHSLAVQDGMLFVGAPYEDSETLGIDSGGVYVYEVGNGGFELKQHIQPPEPSPRDWFGSTLAVAGDMLFIGASGDDDNYSRSGSVFIYERLNDEWVYREKIIAPNGRGGDNFGAGLAVGNNLLAVGAPSRDSVSTRAGAVYVYDLNTGEFIHELIGSDTSFSHGFGRQLVFGEDVLFVGVPNWDTPGGPAGGDNAGAVYVFDSTSGEELMRVNSGIDSMWQRFGGSLAYEDGILLVGAPSHRYHDGEFVSNAGAVFQYRFIGDELLLDAMITPDHAQSNDRFGASVSLMNGTALITKSQEVYQGGGTGRAYIYDIETGEVLEEIVPMDHGQPRNLGITAAMSDQWVILGSIDAAPPGPPSWGFGPNPGGVYFFDREIVGCPANLDGDCELGSGDLDLFMDAFGAEEMSTDINDDGSINYFDVSAFLAAFNAGCP